MSYLYETSDCYCWESTLSVSVLMMTSTNTVMIDLSTYATLSI